MIEALKAKIRNPKVKLYLRKPAIKIGHFQNLHFMWSDGKADYDFSDLQELPNDRCFLNYILFKGVIRRFELGFAEKYTKYRNGKKKKTGEEP